MKLLRQLSRQINTAMLSLVKHFTLQLDGKGKGLVSMAALLEGTKLAHLEVIVISPSKCERAQPAASSTFALKLHTLT